VSTKRLCEQAERQRHGVHLQHLSGGSGTTPVRYAADSAGNASLTGYTDSSNFPWQPLQARKVGFSDVFVSTLKPDGSALLFSTYLGGSPTTTRETGSRWTAPATSTLPVTLSPSTSHPNPFQATFAWEYTRL